MKSHLHITGLLGLLICNVVAVIQFDPSNTDSIKQAASTAAAGMLQYYTGNRPGDTPGTLAKPYYWWEAGAMFGALIDYWYYTGDDQYNDIITKAMLHQSEPYGTFMPSNRTAELGNDDQAFWAISAMSAAENKFPNPPEGRPQWLAMAQAVWNTQVLRWNTQDCGGGLKWQITILNKGYNYRNTISNGCFFNLAARLAVYTGNATYAYWAEKVWDWESPRPVGIGLFDKNYNFWDGSDDRGNCANVSELQWSYNPAVHMLGAANMYNFTNGSAKWEQHLRGIIGNLGYFLENNVMTEKTCEDPQNCNYDQRSFKAYLARWSAATTVRAPFTRELLRPMLEASARAAAAACNGGADGNQCGTYWTDLSKPFQTGVGEQMSTLEVIQTLLVDHAAGPADAVTGISQGDPNAGAAPPRRLADQYTKTITTADRAGAAIVTVMVITFFIGIATWLVMDS